MILQGCCKDSARILQEFCEDSLEPSISTHDSNPTGHEATERNDKQQGKSTDDVHSEGPCFPKERKKTPQNLHNKKTSPSSKKKEHNVRALNKKNSSIETNTQIPPKK